MGDSSLSIFSGVTIHFTSLSMLAGLNQLKSEALPSTISKALKVGINLYTTFITEVKRLFPSVLSC